MGPECAHDLHCSSVHTRVHRHTHSYSAFFFSARLLPPGTQRQRRWQQSERYRTRRCLCWGFRQPPAKRVSSERGGARGRLALTCTGRGGLRRRTRSLLLLCLPRASAAPGLAAPLSAPAAASAPRRRPLVRSSGPRRRRPPPRCGWRLDHDLRRTRRGHSTPSPPHPAAKVKVASSSPRSRDWCRWG